MTLIDKSNEKRIQINELYNTTTPIYAWCKKAISVSITPYFGGRNCYETNPILILHVCLYYN